MKVSYCGIGRVSFIADDGIYVGEAHFQIGDESLPASVLTKWHDLKIELRIEGERTWTFEKVQAELIAKAKPLLSLGSAHLDGATVASLSQYNAQADAEEAAARDADIKAALR
ncbi:hypothetical protein AB7813_03700 [Tardiphaga sp. 20_F10_N6_6]|uniref:hypothetical protein n=1 Tax=Tardiphaga sp. 20_F10_N6_6 TaxID=3240788 RepID=UPI003F8B1BEA